MKACGARPPTSSIPAQAAAATEAQKFDDHPGPLDNLPQNLLVVVLLAVLPDRARLARLQLVRDPDHGRQDRLDPRHVGRDAAALRDRSARGVAGSADLAKGWVVVGVAAGIGAALRVGDAWLRRPLESLGGFFNGLFEVFSNRDYAILVGVQFLVHDDFLRARKFTDTHDVNASVRLKQDSRDQTGPA